MSQVVSRLHIHIAFINNGGILLILENTETNNFYHKSWSEMKVESVTSCFMLESQAIRQHSHQCRFCINVWAGIFSYHLTVHILCHKDFIKGRMLFYCRRFCQNSGVCSNSHSVPFVGLARKNLSSPSKSRKILLGHPSFWSVV